MPKLQGTEDKTPGKRPGVTYYSGPKRVVWNQFVISRVPGQRGWAQPTRRLPLLVAENECWDPAVANVVLHALTCVRQVTPGAIALPSDLNTAGIEPPVATVFPGNTPPTPQLPCDAFTVGRGVGLPQYRIEFRDGTQDGQVVFVDGSQALALPGSHVTVELIVPDNELLIDPAAGSYVFTDLGLIIESEAAASVNWSSRGPASSAPNGMATYTQTRISQTQGDPVLPDIMFFERPPFARTVRVVPPPAFVAGGVVLMAAQFVAGGTFGMGTVAEGLVIGAEYALSPADHTIPAGATHLEVTLPADAIPNGLPVSVIWGIGVT